MRTYLFISLSLMASLTSAADYQLFEENGKYGVRDLQGKVVINAAFDGIGWSDGSFSIIGQVTGYKLNNKWGLINLKEQLITKAEYNSMTHSGGDRVIVIKDFDAVNRKMGCIDLKGNVTVPLKYDGIKVFGLQAIVFNKNGKQFNYGVIDLNGNVIIPMNYKNIFTIGSLRFGVQNKENKSALFSESGKQLTQFDIDSISSFHNNKAIIYQGSNQGVINRDGIIEVTPRYREIILGEKEVKARMISKWILMDDNNSAIDTAYVDGLTPLVSGFISQQGKYFGVWNKDFQPILINAYENIQQVAGNLVVAKKDNRFGVIQYDATSIIPFRYDSVLLSGKFVRVRESLLGKPLWTLYDTFGIRKSEKSYELIDPFNGKFFLVKNYGLSGVMDQYGKETVHCLYDTILDFNQDQIVVKFHGHYGIIDFRENWLLPPQPHPVELVDEDHYLLQEYGTKQFKNFKGDLIYFTDNPLTAQAGLLKEVLPDGTEKEINFQGITISRTTPPVTEDTEIISDEHEGFRGIKRNGKYGFIDQKGRLRIANRYERIGNFQNGLAPVRILGKWGFINTEDKIVINPSYAFVSPFMKSVAIVKKDKYGFVNREGNIVLEPRYDSIHQISTNNFLIYKDQLIGLASESGKVLIEPRFDTLQDLNNGFVIISRDKKFGLITKEGFSTIPMIYDKMFYLPQDNKYLVKMDPPWTNLNLN